jgi:phage-related protein
MANFPTFAPPFAPLEPLENSLQPRFLSASFGDGYTQVTPDGLNAEQASLELTFQPLSVAQYYTMESFLEVNSTTGFYYALPIDGVTRIWVAAKWSATRYANYYGMAVSLVQIFPVGG